MTTSIAKIEETLCHVGAKDEVKKACRQYMKETHVTKAELDIEVEKLTHTKAVVWIVERMAVVAVVAAILGLVVKHA